MKFRRQGKELVFGKGCHGGLNRTRTYDLSHVSLWLTGSLDTLS